MPPVIFRGAKARGSNIGSLSLSEGGKDYLLQADIEQDVPADVVKRLKSDEFKDFNIDFGSKPSQED